MPQDANNGLVIRPATPADAGTIARIYNHYVENTHITFDLAPVDAENRLAWMAQFDPASRHRLIVGCDEEHAVVGFACSARLRTKPAYDQSVETTIYLDEAQTGKGYGVTLYGALFDALASADVHRCYGVIALPNDASVRLHEQFGFEPVGQLTEVGYKFGRYWDTLWMEKRLL